MSALDAARLTAERQPGVITLSRPVKGGVQLFPGAIVVQGADGYAKPGATATGLTALGRAEAAADNRLGDDGDMVVVVKRGVFRFDNSAGGDQITAAEIDAAAYLVDDQTVAKTDAGGTRSRAGIVRDVDADGVWIELGSLAALSAGGLVATNNLSDVSTPATARANLGANLGFLQVPALDLASANTAVGRVVAPVAGTLKHFRSVTNGALATGDATITAAINGIPVTNGQITIAQAGSAAGDRDLATPTAANTFAAGDLLTFTVGGTNDAAVTAALVADITY